MLAAWPLGWSMVLDHVMRSGVRPIDVLFSLSPAAAVCGGFFLARSRVAERGALTLLSLGFGALAPAREGEPPRCRRCLGPLPGEGLGGIVQCRYCGAENVAGLDLRPVVDKARGEAKTFDKALAVHRKERRLWRLLGAAALVVLGAWVWWTSAYLRGSAGPLEHWPHPPELGDD
jgi:hypothetical protein